MYVQVSNRKVLSHGFSEWKFPACNGCKRTNNHKMTEAAAQMKRLRADIHCVTTALINRESKTRADTQKITENPVKR